MRTLVVVAHPDDEVLGCGGTIARLAGRGEQVQIAILSDGETSRYDDPRDASEEVIAQRRVAATDAASVLGVPAPRTFAYPDNRFDTVPLLDITKTIEALLRDFEPDIVFTHHAGDMNIDHRCLAHAVLTATRPVPESAVLRVYAFEVPSSSHVAPGHFGPPFLPNTFVDVSETLEAKIEALQCYGREARDFPHPRSPDAIRSLAVTRGATCGLKAAEAFVLVREIQPGAS